MENRDREIYITFIDTSAYSDPSKKIGAYVPVSKIKDVCNVFAGDKTYTGLILDGQYAFDMSLASVVGYDNAGRPRSVTHSIEGDLLLIRAQWQGKEAAKVLFNDNKD